MTKIKICGLKRIEDISYVNELVPDYVGFVFAGHKRKINKETALELKKHLKPEILSVGVFVDEPIDNIVDLVRLNVLDIVQLHGNEDEAYIAQLKEQIDVPIIKAVKVQTTEDILEAKKLPIDYLLLDTYSKNEIGGTGKRFNHSLIPDKIGDYFLAGGLSADNLKEVITKYHPYAVDLSSSVETDGIKDRNKIKEVINIVRTFD